MRLGSWLYIYRIVQNYEVRMCERFQNGHSVNQRFSDNYLVASEKITKAKNSIEQPNDHTLLLAMRTIGKAICNSIPIAKIRKIDKNGVEIPSATCKALDIPVSDSPKRALGGVQEVGAKLDYSNDIIEDEFSLQVFNGSTIASNELENILAKKTRLPRFISHVLLSKDREVEICQKFSLPHVYNKDLRHGQEDKFKCNIGKPNCYFRALSLRITGREDSHSIVRQQIMRFIDSTTDSLLKRMYQTSTIQPNLRESPANSATDVSKYARFPLDFVAASKRFNVNVIVCNGSNELEIYRPDDTVCRPMMNLPNPEVSSIALHYEQNHVNLINSVIECSPL